MTKNTTRDLLTDARFKTVLPISFKGMKKGAIIRKATGIISNYHQLREKYKIIVLEKDYLERRIELLNEKCKFYEYKLKSRISPKNAKRKMRQIR